MSTVSVKKSVLQSIIKKSLSEGDFKKSDPSRRLTVGPDLSSLPAELPLTPSDRMSTQIEVERPPVEDEDYTPMNQRELGFALQALSSMVPTDHVEKAYMAFKSIIEQIEEEGSDDEEIQIESVRRKTAILRALLGEAEDEYRGAGKLMYQTYKDTDLGSPDEDETTSKTTLRDVNVDRILREYPDALGNLGLVKSDLFKLLGLVDDILISNSDLEIFMEILEGMESVDDKTMDKVQKAFFTRRDKDLANFVKFFIRTNTVAAGGSAKPAKPSKKAAPKVEIPGEFAWQEYAKKFGFAAASGIRQSFIRDITGVRAVAAYVTGKNELAYIKNSILEAFEDALSSPRNKAVLETLIEEEGLQEFRNLLEEDPKLLTRTETYKNFAGLITYEALSRIAEMSFKGMGGKGAGRRIGDAFQAEFGKEKPSSRELKQLEDMSLAGDYSDLVDSILDEAEQNNYINFLTAALLMAAEDPSSSATAAELAAHEYAKPAFATLKSFSSGKKPPELALGDFVEPSPEGEAFVSQVKAARKLGRK
jgi:hypothetical protein